MLSSLVTAAAGARERHGSQVELAESLALAKLAQTTEENQEKDGARGSGAARKKNCHCRARPTGPLEHVDGESGNSALGRRDAERFVGCGSPSEPTCFTKRRTTILDGWSKEGVSG